jgi:hypothetical protein
MTNLAISTSFVQDQRHTSKSARFVPVQPSQIADVLKDHGLFLDVLKTSVARCADRADHQTSIARYVAADSADMVAALGAGSKLAIFVKAPHLTGSIELRLGFFRGSCANQWNHGKLIDSVKVSHLGNCLENLNRAIPALVARREEVAASIGAMGARQLSAQELADLAVRVADIRLGETDRGRRVRLAGLLHTRRAEDRRGDLFTAANVLQENALRYGLQYELETDRGVRNMTSRPVIETTATALEMTGSIWEAAAALLER